MSALKQILLAAIEAPVKRLYPTASEAQSARFNMYNALRRMRRQVPPDPFGGMNELLEFVVKKLPNGQAELVIQKKATALVGSLEDWQPAGPPGRSPQPTPHIPPPSPIDTTPLQRQLKNETAEEVDPNTEEGEFFLAVVEADRLMEIADSHLPSDKYAQATTLRSKLGRKAMSLEEFKAELSKLGVD